MFKFLMNYTMKFYNYLERSSVLFEQKKKEFKDYIKTDVTFIDPAVAREQSVKAVYETTYDRYTAKDKHGNLKYHSEPKETEGN